MLETPDKNLRDNLTREMKRRGWDKATLARMCELSPSTLYPVFDERQLAWPQPMTLARLARGLGISVGDLISAGPREITARQALEVIARELETHRETSPRDPAQEGAKPEPPDPDLECAKALLKRKGGRLALRSLLAAAEAGQVSPEQEHDPPEKGK